MGDGEKIEYTRRKRINNMWLKAYTLVRNPVLVVDRNKRVLPHMETRTDSLEV